MTTPLLYNVLFAWKCSSTHHKLALDALRHLQCPDAERWRDFFLAHIEPYLDGTKAPDNRFKDFRNHVLHVSENYWGGAVKTAETWYAKTVQAFRERRWSDAVFNAGVLSHYYSDPWQPFHTGQSEAEGIVHRAAEWSIACGYLELQQILEEDCGGYPDVSIPDGDDWLAQMVRDAAATSHDYYQLCIDHYNFDIGRKQPAAGYDQEGKDAIAVLLGSAVIGFARILDRIILETEARPPSVNLTLLGVLSQLTIPIFWVTKQLKHAHERRAIEAMYQEYQTTGKVIRTLSEDDATLRQLHAAEVLQKPLEQLDQEPAGPIGSAYGTGTAPRPKTVAAAAPPPVPQGGTPKSQAPAPPRGPRYYLTLDDPLEAAPSIGPKTAERLETAGLSRVRDLLAAVPEQVARKLNLKHIDANVLRSWQAQARLVCEVPGLRGHDAQFLVACGVMTVAELQAAQPHELTAKVTAYVKTPSGERILRDGKPPDEHEVQGWIAAAQSLRAAA